MHHISVMGRRQRTIRTRFQFANWSGSGGGDYSPPTSPSPRPLDRNNGLHPPIIMVKGSPFDYFPELPSVGEQTVMVSSGRPVRTDTRGCNRNGPRKGILSAPMAARRLNSKRYCSVVVPCGVIPCTENDTIYATNGSMNEVNVYN
jgi:hypothetical protein